MTVTLDRRARDELYLLAANDLDGIGDILHWSGQRRDLSRVQHEAATLRAISALLNLIGWDLHDPRDTYPVDLPADDLTALLHRWRDQLDGGLRDESQEPPEDRHGVDTDLETRLVVDRLLAALHEACTPR